MKLRRFRETLGLAQGYGLGLFTGAVSFVRQARMFHPCGITYRATVEPVDAAIKLPRHALLRFSSAWWKKKEWVDVLGIAIRFSDSSEFTEVAKLGDQDLLFATIRHPWTMAFAPLTTQFHDFLANRYYAVTPFSVPTRPMKDAVLFRLVPEPIVTARGSRSERLAEAVLTKQARFDLDYAPDSLAPQWQTFARIEIAAPISLEQAKVQFNPFRTGAGIHPRGFIHFLRVGAYRLSQRMRPGSR